MFETGKKPEEIIEEKWFKPVDSSEIESIVKQVFEENPQAVADVKGWNEKSIGFLIWQVVRKSSWKANPKQAKENLFTTCS